MLSDLTWCTIHTRTWGDLSRFWAQASWTWFSSASHFTANLLRNEFHFILPRYARFFRAVLKNAAVGNYKGLLITRHFTQLLCSCWH